MTLSRADRRRDDEALENAKLQRDIVVHEYLEETDLSSEEENRCEGGRHSRPKHPRGDVSTAESSNVGSHKATYVNASAGPALQGKTKSGMKQALDKASTNARSKIERSAQRAGQKLSATSHRRYKRVGDLGDSSSSSDETSDGDIADDQTMETVQKYRSQAQLEADEPFDSSQPVVVVERSVDGESHIKTLPDGTLKVVIGRSHYRAKVAVAPKEASDEDCS